MQKKDVLHRFLIESANVRGAFVSIDQAWVEARRRVDYPAQIQRVLGQAFAASMLLSTTIKFAGKMTVQIRGDGAVHLLVIQVTADRKMRGLARWSRLPEDDTLNALFGPDARMTITIEANVGGEPYQGIVELSGSSLSEALQAYFINSEQLDTALILATDDQSATGLLLQKMPPSDAANSDAEHADAWQRVQLIASTLNDQELLDLAVEPLLGKLYHDERVRLFEGQSVVFDCSCSKDRTDGLIKGLGLAEAQDILQEQGDITITCEFCDEVYRYNKADVAELFKQGDQSPDLRGPTLH